MLGSWIFFVVPAHDIGFGGDSLHSNFFKANEGCVGYVGGGDGGATTTGAAVVVAAGVTAPPGGGGTSGMEGTTGGGGSTAGSTGSTTVAVDVAGAGGGATGTVGAGVMATYCWSNKRLPEAMEVPASNNPIMVFMAFVRTMYNRGLLLPN